MSYPFRTKPIVITIQNLKPRYLRPYFGTIISLEQLFLSDRRRHCCEDSFLTLRGEFTLVEGLLPEVFPAAAGEGDGGQHRRMLLWEGVHEEGGQREEGEGEEMDNNRHAVTAIIDVFDGDWSDTGTVSSTRVD